MKRALKKKRFPTCFSQVRNRSFFSSLFPTLAESLECNIHLYNKSTWSGNCHRAIAIFLIQQVVYHKLESNLFRGFYSKTHVNGGIVRIAFFQ